MRRHHAQRTRIAVAVATLALGPMFTACGGDDAAETDATDAPADDAPGDADVDDSTGESESAATDDGSTDGAGGDGSSDIGDFPIPAPSGLLLDALADSGIPMDSQRQLYYPTDDFDRLVDFYDGWTSENGNWARSEAEGTVVFQDIGGSNLQMITVSPEHDAGAQADGPVTFLLLVTDQ